MVFTDVKEETSTPRVELKKREKGYSKCGGYVGYLAHLPENAEIPRECLACPKVMDCVLRKSGYSEKTVKEIWKWYDYVEKKGVANW
jgi:hypothetical protein